MRSDDNFKNIGIDIDRETMLRDNEVSEHQIKDGYVSDAKQAIDELRKKYNLY